jgi:lambda repressor-like predicted transcriptional regulator
MIRHGLQDPRRSLPRQRHRTPPQNVESRRQRLKSRYGDAVDVQRAADLYVQGWTLRQIGTELGVHWSTVSQQLRSAGISMRSAGPAAHPASTQQIVILRDQGMTWDEIAEQVGMTASGVWSRYRKARPPNLTPGPLAAGARRRARQEPCYWRTGSVTVSPRWVVPVCFTCRAPIWTPIQGDRT